MSTPKAIGFVEFVVLMALLSGVVTLATDAMLPALPQIGQELNIQESNDRQLIIFVFFFGLSLSQIIYGPLSDSYGRKPVMYGAICLFCLGSEICAFVRDFDWMLVGRFLMGVGAAGPRVLSMAIIRDRYVGRDMARVSSLIMMVFIASPIIAPYLGQFVSQSIGWRYLFSLLNFGVLVMLIWMVMRLEETHPRSRQLPLSVSGLIRDFRAAFADLKLRYYMIASGLMFAPFIFFLGASQQLLGELYGLGDQFPAAFAALSAVFGVASFVNAGLVRRMGMRRLSALALLGGGTSAFLILALCWVYQGVPPIFVMFVYFIVSFFSSALVFGNFSALGMEDVGDIAGSAASLQGAVSTFIGVFGAHLFGGWYANNLYPFVIGFILCVLGAGGCMWLAHRNEIRQV